MARRNQFEGVTCYTCGRPAVGVEHAPPQSCFPKGKREQPITVPACAKHNQDKNLEDELIKATVVLSNNGSPDGMEVLESVIRAMENDEAKMKVFMPLPKLVKINGVDRGTCRINLARFNRSITLIVRALWFKERGQKLHANIQVQWHQLKTSNLDPHPALGPLSKLANARPGDYKGFYPEIFRYDFHECPDKKGVVHWVCRLCFYDALPIITTWAVKP